jgi:DNA-binding transcriptional MerR regulator
LRLRATGMSIEEMQRYAQLREQGELLSSVAERKAMLARHTAAVEEEVRAMQETLAYLHQKIALYSTLESELQSKEKQHGKHAI